MQLTQCYLLSMKLSSHAHSLNPTRLSCPWRFLVSKAVLQRWLSALQQFGKQTCSTRASMCELDRRQEKSNLLRMKTTRCRAVLGAGAASKEGLRTAEPVHDLCMTGHDNSSALQAEKEGSHSKLAQCQIDKETVTANRDELQAARNQLAAQLATTEAKVGP